MENIKRFKVASVSSNANGFGLFGHILIAEDGEAWEVARGRSSGSPWEQGQVVEVPYVLDHYDKTDHDPWTNKPRYVPGGPQWHRLSCETPRRLPAAPPGVVAEVWGRAA